MIIKTYLEKHTIYLIIDVIYNCDEEKKYILKSVFLRSKKLILAIQDLLHYKISYFLSLKNLY